MPNTTLEQVTRLAEQLPTDEQSRLIKHLLHNLRAARGKSDATPDLYGAWQGKFPEDIDLDAELAEIRGEWLKELDEIEGEPATSTEKR